MYKVFVNEKKLLLSDAPQNMERRLKYEDLSTIEIAIDLLQNTSCPEINIYYSDLEQLWQSFRSIFKIVEAAGGIVKNENGKILFIKRLGKWDLPKGKIEKGEVPGQAALRELEEETGLNELILKHYVNNTFHIYKERNGDLILKTTHWFAMQSLGNKKAKPQIEEGISEVAWMNEQEISEVVFPNTFKNIRLILGEYRR